jgi:atypical dual specificity phosphatase
VLGCAYPRREAALQELAQQGVSVLVNLHERPHDPLRLTRHGLKEVHIPVKDFTAPRPEHLEKGVAAISWATAAGKRVAVHCGGGLGRTGTLLACYLTHNGMTARDAIARVRTLRPGSVETREQAEAVVAFAQHLRRLGSHPG